jgi:hypothetical protein
MGGQNFRLRIFEFFGLLLIERKKKLGGGGGGEGRTPAIL